MTTPTYSVIKKKILEYFEKPTPYDFSGLCGYNLLSITFKHLENFF